MPSHTLLGVHHGDINPGAAHELQPGVCRLSSHCSQVFAPLSHLGRRRCRDLSANTFGKGAGPHPRARISVFSARPLPLERLCWCPTPMQSLGVAGAWLSQALEGGQGCLRKSRRSSQMLTPRKIRGGPFAKEGGTVDDLPLQTLQKPQVRGMPWDGEGAAGR